MGSKSSPNSSNSSTPVAIKKENQEEEIKDLAETAMNELLGWYGYERLELRRWAAASANSGSPESSSRKSPGETKDNDSCSWCNNLIKEPNNALNHLGARFCSEICFSQSRRANFKRAKTCDWCRHVRHTVAYVDFQDGASQLQFCSDKCLNQYKMHIFCRETQAHLDLHPHLQGSTSGTNLITPDLWLKNCRSRSNSPVSRNSVESDRVSPPADVEKVEVKETSPKQLITVAPASKLLKAKQDKEIKKECKPSKLLTRMRRSSRSSSVTSQMNFNVKSKDPIVTSPVKQVPPSASPPKQSSRPIPPLHPFPVNLGHPMGINGPFNFPPRHFNMQETMNFPSFPSVVGQPPPVTVMMPYPVFIPIPLPIPVPIPISNILSALHEPKPNEIVQPDDCEGPLDCTVGANKTKEDVEDNLNSRLVFDDTSEEIKTADSNAEQALPKFKITRLGSKMAKVVQKSREQPSPESMRPLRKRRRLVEVPNEDESAIIPKSRKVLQV